MGTKSRFTLSLPYGSILITIMARKAHKELPWQKKLSRKGTDLGPYGPYEHYSVVPLWAAHWLGLGPVVIATF